MGLRHRVDAWRHKTGAIFALSGKSAKTCQALFKKIFRYACRANQWLKSARLTRQEGRLAIVTNVR
jgi:hypothetical protein